MPVGNVPMHPDSHQRERVSRRFLPLPGLLLPDRCAPANRAALPRISLSQRGVISQSAPTAIAPLQQKYLRRQQRQSSSVLEEVGRTRAIRLGRFWLEIYTWWEFM